MGGYANIVKKVVSAARSTAKLMKTGQTTSHRTGDDGDLERGRNVDFFTLAENNPFGNANRFTDELGGQDYTNDIVIDWSTYDGTTVLGWYRIPQLQTYAQHLLNAAALTIGTFAIWTMPNLNEQFSIRANQQLCFNYAPFNINLNTYFFTSTPNPENSNQQMGIYGGIGGVQPLSENLRYAMYARVFTVNGTTLT